MLTRLETPWRKAFEANSAIVWLIASVFSFIAIKATQFPAGYLWATGLFGLFMAVYRASQAYELWHTKAQLAGRNIAWLEPETLQKRTEEHPAKLFLGYGFNWEQPHVQRLYDLRKLDVTAVLPPRWFMKVRKWMGGDVAVNLKGKEWIHGLEKKEIDVEVPLDHLAGGTLIFGTTGSGKTRLFELLCTQAIHRKNTAVIVFDPKGDVDIRRRLQRECERAGRPEAFMHLHPAFPSMSVRLDPLKNWSQPTEIATRISALIPTDAGDNAFKAFGWRAVNQIVQGLVEIEERPNLLNIRRYIEGGPDHLLQTSLTAFLKKNIPDWEVRVQPYMKKADKGDYNKERPTATTPSSLMALVRFYKQEVPEKMRSSVVDGLLSMFEHERVHAMKLIASLLPILAKLTTGDMGPLLSPDGTDANDTRPIIDVRKVIEAKQVLYIGLNALPDAEVGAAIGAIFLADLAAVAGFIYNYGGNGTEINVFVDESAEVICPPFVQILNKGRGAGVKTFFAAQSLPDFIAKTGNEPMARMILANANNLIALRTMDDVTQEFIVRSMGKVPIRVAAYSQDTSAIVDRDPTNYSGGYGERVSEEEKEVVTPELLNQLPDLQYIASVSAGRHVKGRLPLLRQDRGPRLEEMPWVASGHHDVLRETTRRST
jgi:conjugal transfer pilus assembly protein TraD